MALKPSFLGILARKRVKMFIASAFFSTIAWVARKSGATSSRSFCDTRQSGGRFAMSPCGRESKGNFKAV